MLFQSTVNELVGRTDLLRKADLSNDVKASRLDLSKILDNSYADPKTVYAFDPKQVYDFELANTLDEKVLIKKLKPSLDKSQPKNLEINITNIDRTFGTILGSEITKRFADTLEDDTYVVKCKGSGGQSFGAFIPNGLTLELEIGRAHV